MHSNPSGMTLDDNVVQWDRDTKAFESLQEAQQDCHGKGMLYIFQYLWHVCLSPPTEVHSIIVFVMASVTIFI